MLSRHILYGIDFIMLLLTPILSSIINIAENKSHVGNGCPSKKS